MTLAGINQNIFCGKKKTRRAYALVSSILFTGRKAASFSCRLQSGIGGKVCSARYQAIEQTEDGEVFAIADKDVESLKSWLLLLWRTGALPVNLLLIPVNLFRWCDWKFPLAVLSLIPLNAVTSVLIARKLPKYHQGQRESHRWYS